LDEAARAWRDRSDREELGRMLRALLTRLGSPPG
jgi:hypothetical protein